ncbi:MAG: PSP1 C-terminal domain-containing protein, partial [Actinomycetota bacterium]
MGYRVVVETEVGEFIGRVALTPRRREPYTEPYEILRLATEEDEAEESRHRELGREIRTEAQKLARDHGVEKVSFIGCDVSLDERYVEVKYQSEERTPDLSAVRRGLERTYNMSIEFKRFVFIERSADASGCDTCGLPL